MPEKPAAAATTPEVHDKRPLAYDTGILADRYLSIILADTGGTAILLLQAPIIGSFIAFAWKDGVQNAGILNFILALVAVWFGCVNGCREVVKERLIFLREKRLGVSVRAYLLSKFMVLALLAFIQCLTLTLIMYNGVPSYKLSRPSLFLLLYAASLAGTCLGLLISSVVKSQNTAVGLVPIVLIPQVIFSEVVLGSKKNRPEEVESVMPVAWTYEALNDLWGSDWQLSTVVASLVMLTLLSVSFLTVSAFVLKLSSEE